MTMQTDPSHQTNGLQALGLNISLQEEQSEVRLPTVEKLGLESSLEACEWKIPKH